MISDTLSVWLSKLAERKGSDLHLMTGCPPMIRITGELIPIEGEGPLTCEFMQAFLAQIVPERLRPVFAEAGEVDFRYSSEALHIASRVNFYETLSGQAAVLRLIPETVPTLAELGIDESLSRLSMLQQGLVLVTGPTGSGKSTVLAALVDYANHHRRDHIISIEDPIEFTYRNALCLVSQRETGTHTKSFAAALRAALREDPDIIIVGEMRDLETIKLALHAAETGHLVFATLHTSSAARTIDRIINMYPEAEQGQARLTLSESLSRILSVRLIKRADGQGRVQAMGILHVTGAVRSLIRDGRVFQINDVMQTGRNLGMKTLDMSLAELVLKNTITMEAAQANANSPGDFADIVEGQRHFHNAGR